MDDRFLEEMRREPRPEFAHELHERLRRQGPAASPVRRARPLRLGFALGGAVAVALIAMSFTIPAVRASAQAFLDLFRVRNFAAVSVDPAKLERLKDKSLGLETLLDQQTERLEAPGAPQVVGSTTAAAALAGYPVLVPARPPTGYTPDTIRVTGQGAARFTVNAPKIDQLLETLGLTDIKLPPDLDGKQVTIRTSRAVVQTFVRDKHELFFVQAPSPEVSMPAGLDLPQLGEIALRVAGLDRAEAHRFAQSIDWHSTLVVPVPIGASSFSQMTVRGQPGLFVTIDDTGAKAGEHRRGGHVLLWSQGEMVYGLTGSLDRVSMVEMAESLR